MPDPASSWRSRTSWSAGAIGLIVIDSVAALVPKAEIEGDGRRAHGPQARLMSQALRKLTAATARNNTAVVFINQLRQRSASSAPGTTTGGNALKFTRRCVSTSADRRGQNGEQVVGNARVKVVKNKVAPPFRGPSSTSSTA